MDAGFEIFMVGVACRGRIGGILCLRGDVGRVRK